MLLEDRVAIVTGGGHGIGHAYCLGIAGEGGKVVVADIDAAAADAVAEEIGGQGGQALAVHADVASFASCQDMARRALIGSGASTGSSTTPPCSPPSRSRASAFRTSVRRNGTAS